jgi:hypothetical protein
VLHYLRGEVELLKGANQKRIVIACLIVLSQVFLVQVTSASDVALRFIRSYGGTNEMLPPIVSIDGASEAVQGFVSEFATVEFDLRSNNFPNVYARLVHCQADWTEDENAFLSDVTNRTTLVEWRLAPSRSTYYTHRGTIQIPNVQMQLRFAGNWKVKLFDMDGDVQLGETKLFVVKEMASVSMNFMTDFYEPEAKVSTIALTLEAIVRASRGSTLIDGFQHSMVFYRNHRWHEPFMVSTKYSEEHNPPSTSTGFSGILNGGKIYRIARIPAQNEYRVLDLSNLAMYPFSGAPVRMPLTDLRRNGMFIERADDGAMVTRAISGINDEYIPIEFLLNPDPGDASEKDVFVSGSFNQWKPDRNWMMYFDESLRLYRLRQWVRRGRHNYMYATGNVNADNGKVDNLSYEEMEGNTASAAIGYIAFAYYRVPDYGGYDAIVGLNASNIYQSSR